MTRAIIAFLIGVLILGTVGGVAFQIGVAAGAAATGTAGASAVAAYPYAWHAIGFGFFPFFGFLFPLLFLFLIFGAMRAAFGGGHGYGRYRNGPRMFEEWHREAHERGTGGKAES